MEAATQRGLPPNLALASRTLHGPFADEVGGSYDDAEAENDADGNTRLPASGETTRIEGSRRAGDDAGARCGGSRGGRGVVGRGVPAVRPVVATIGRHDARQAVRIRDRLEVALNVR